VVLLSFAAGSLLTHWLMRGNTASADSPRLFQLMIYHTAPGKVPALESVFRDVSRLQAKHHLDVVGYWVPTPDSEWKDAFVYLVAHKNREDADANWKALHADPAFLPYRKAAEPLIEKVQGDYHVDEVYLQPTDFSAMK
jgi:NIPSNAP